jgi:hypothetical protein
MEKTKEELRGTLIHAVLNLPLSGSQVEDLVEALYPLFKPVDLDGKTVILELASSGKVPDEVMMRYCAYIDFLKSMGAKSAVFVEKGTKVETLTDRELERFGLRRL